MEPQKAAEGRLQLVAIGLTLDFQYTFYLPVVTLMWRKLGWTVLGLVAAQEPVKEGSRAALAIEAARSFGARIVFTGNCPLCTNFYHAQMNRMFASCLQDIPDGE